MRPFLLAIMGPTASGKTALAERIADHLDAELINADAFMVYRGLDIGTAKPSNRERYRILDCIDPRESFGLGRWLQLAGAELALLWENGSSAIVVGGTGLYVRALFEGYDRIHSEPDRDLRLQLERREKEEGLQRLAEELNTTAPEIAARTDLKNPVRVRRALERLADSRPATPVRLPPFRRTKFGLMPQSASLEKRIRQRIDAMFKSGWPREVAELKEQGVSWGAPGMRAIGYGTVAEMNGGRLSLSEAIDRVAIETTQYAKRQRTWLRREPNLHLFCGFGDTEAAFASCLNLIESTD